MAAYDSSAPRYMPPLEVLSAEDFETASIRSAAPSYSKSHQCHIPVEKAGPPRAHSCAAGTSEAPSYHSTATHGETIPPYSPRAVETSGSATSSSGPSTSSAPPTLLPPHSSGGPASASASASARGGLPPIPPLQPRRPADLPNLTAFRIPSWSTMSSNPTARHYQRVAHRRVAAANSQSHLQGIRRMVLDRIDEDERNRFRPLEDPYLVGEEAARRARQERLARENGDDVLVMEDRCWDGFLAELRGWEERERNGKQFRQFRREMESLTSSSSSSSRGGRFARRFGFR
ncbi:uncharacterized protein E0L32_008371 [Thyridium curvatum]|uniref:Uncharacterized protein n=1 Tax=Thyridium curvatum TaxID=1093900 RepID=A0A507AT47_9PEZI|nr:uncharacterized protein E0L32_008371 [Thyridium curvatum]TPX10637.1 hypothetical protein E0L32_008371 [Thyridium curvatum]